ncbi:glycoside hydrolase family 3 protein [Treponema parvum]|uniref:beta-N-acetylhexosaminidase n=1 Tax=Treponema parvum TaxID=138851 RepID=A0A975ICT1_9SPIR|nr:glycoside hydrolase family 3 N-terminal domain-containing protein [Treponema parvum]QTQ11429.1 glycoside hydrolase family 3 protein [Treponema parvum]QTQ16630.1 glycoside hydrolase family 3 protein [Treponema parvum]
MKKTHVLLSVFIFASCCAFLSCRRNPTSLSKKERFERALANKTQEALVEIQKKQDEAILSYISSLPEEQKISQLFLVNIVGNEEFFPVERSSSVYDEGEDTYLVPGGCLFFSYNIAPSPEKIIAFNDSIRNFCIKNDIVPPFSALDQEGGAVSRLRGIAGPLPSNKRVRERLSVEKAYRLYFLQGVQMKELGFHMNLAPVAEPENDENRLFLGERSYGGAEDVIAYGTAALNGFENGGVGCILKHFPGNTGTDPHTGLPEITWNEEELKKNALIPFGRLVMREPSGILMTHARFSSFDAHCTDAHDAKNPACLSSYWISEVLRAGLGHEGIVVSDDIFMDALQKNGFPPEKAAVMAVKAGIDCIMISEKRFAPFAGILIREAQKDSEFRRRIDEAVMRMINWKIKKNILCVCRDEDGNYFVRASLPESAKKRLERFLAARSENIEIYRQEFLLSQDKSFASGSESAGMRK